MRNIKHHYNHYKKHVNKKSVSIFSFVVLSILTIVLIVYYTKNKSKLNVNFINDSKRS
jgi:CHASE3 domain sensor protein